MQVLDDRTVLVHGLAMNPKAVALLNRRRSALIICPTSNQFLFHCTPIVDIDQVHPHCRSRQ